MTININKQNTQVVNYYDQSDLNAPDIAILNFQLINMNFPGGLKGTDCLRGILHILSKSVWVPLGSLISSYLSKTCMSV